MCVLPADSQTAWVAAPLIVRMTVGARGRESSVADHPPPPLLRPHPPTAGWPAAGVGGPVAGAALAPETGTETGGEGACITHSSFLMRGRRDEDCVGDSLSCSRTLQQDSLISRGATLVLMLHFHLVVM